MSEISDLLKSTIGMLQIYAICDFLANTIEPADLTVHPPPKKDRGWVHFFLYRCLVHQNFFLKEKMDFVGDIKR